MTLTQAKQGHLLFTARSGSQALQDSKGAGLQAMLEFASISSPLSFPSSLPPSLPFPYSLSYISGLLCT